MGNHVRIIPQFPFPSFFNSLSLPILNALVLSLSLPLYFFHYVSVYYFLQNHGGRPRSEPSLTLVFHVTLLKQSTGAEPVDTVLPTLCKGKEGPMEPEAIIDRRVIHNQGVPLIQVLVK